MPKEFKNKKGSGKRIGNISDAKVSKYLDIPTTTLRRWRNSRPLVYALLKSFNEQELVEQIKEGSNINLK